MIESVQLHAAGYDFVPAAFRTFKMLRWGTLSRRGVACGVAYAYKDTGADRPFPAVTIDP